MILSCQISKLLALSIILFIWGCSNNNSADDYHVKNKGTDINTNVNYDSIMFPMINEQYYDNFSISSEDTLVRIIFNRSFNNVFVFLFEKNDSLITISIKEIPRQYYNPFVRFNETIMQYAFCKKKLSNKQWNDFIDIIQLNIDEDDNNYASTLDGEYIYIEVKTKNRHIKTLFWQPYSSNKQQLLNFFEHFIGN